MRPLARRRGLVLTARMPRFTVATDISSPSRFSLTQVSRPRCQRLCMVNFLQSGARMNCGHPPAKEVPPLLVASVRTVFSTFVRKWRMTRSNCLHQLSLASMTRLIGRLVTRDLQLRVRHRQTIGGGATSMLNLGTTPTAPSIRDFKKEATCLK